MLPSVDCRPKQNKTKTNMCAAPFHPASRPVSSTLRIAGTDRCGYQIPLLSRPPSRVLPLPFNHPYFLSLPLRVNMDASKQNPATDRHLPRAGNRTRQPPAPHACVTCCRMLNSLIMPSSALMLLIICSCVNPTQNAGVIWCAFFSRYISCATPLT